MSAGDYLEGTLVFALMGGGVCAGALLLARRRLAHLRGVDRLLALALLVTLGVLAVHLVPAGLGLLSRAAVLATTAAWVLGCTLVRAAPQPRAAPAPSVGEPPGESRLAWALALLGLGLTIAFVIASLRDQAVLPPYGVDMLNFHLPGVGAWIETGSIWQVDNFVADLSPGNYPNSGDVLLLAAVLPWNSDFLAHLSMYPFGLLAGASVYALAVELRAPRPAALVAGCLLVAIPAVAIPAFVHGLPDSVALFGFGTGLLFLARHRRTEATPDLVIAGLALGLAAGSKWYGVSSVAVVVCVWAVASWFGGWQSRLVVRRAASVVGLVGLTAGVWLLRNWLESGNPFFPVELAPFGLTIFAAPADVVREAAGFTIAGYAGDLGTWGEFILPQFRDALAAAGGLIVVGAVAAAAVVGSRWRGQVAERGLVLTAIAGALLLGLVYSITPYTAGGPADFPVLVGANSRYLLPALMVGAALAAWAARAAPWGSSVFAALSLVALLDGIRQSSIGISSTAVLEASRWLFAVIAVALAAGLCWGLWRGWRGLEPRRRRPALAALVAVGLAGTVLVGDRVQQSFSENRYFGSDAAIDHILERAPSGYRVGLAGVWDPQGLAPPLPAFGRRYGNEVAYVGEYVEGTLRRFTNRAAFAAALEQGAYDLLLVGRGSSPGQGAAEERWAHSAGFERVAASERLALYRSPAPPLGED